MMIRRVFIAAAAATALVTVGSAAVAHADTTPAASAALPSPALTFVPPSVGPICVVIGPIILGGKLMNPGIHECLQGTSLPPMALQPTQ